jgi:hypothetical protein
LINFGPLPVQRQMRKVIGGTPIIAATSLELNGLVFQFMEGIPCQSDRREPRRRRGDRLHLDEDASR